MALKSRQLLVVFAPDLNLDFQSGCIDGPVVVVYHITIVAIGHGLLKKF